MTAMPPDAPAATLTRLSRHYTVIAVLGGLALFAAVLLLSYLNYQELRSGWLTEMRHDLLEYRDSVGRIAGQASAHVDRLHRAALDQLSMPHLAKESAMRALLQPRADDPAHPEARLHTTDTAPDSPLGPAMGQVLAVPDFLAAGRTAEDELDMALALFPHMRVAHHHNSALRWSYYFSGSRQMLSLYPWVPSTDLVPDTRNGEPAGLLRAFFDYDVATLGRPEVNPRGEPYWTEPYLDAAGAGLMVSHARPIHSAGQYLGLVGTDILLEVFAEFVHGLDTRGRLWLVSPNGRILADSATRMTTADDTPRWKEVAPVALAQLDPASLAAAPGEVRTLGHYSYVALPVAGTPWTLMLTASRDEMLNDILPSILPTSLLLSLLVIAVLAGQWLIRRLYVTPAIAIARYIQRASINRNEPLPKLPAFWKTWPGMVARAFDDAHRYLAELQDSENLKSGIVASAPVCVISVDRDGNIREFNPEAERCFGLARSEVMGHPMLDIIVPPRLREAHAQGFRRFVATNEGRILGQRVELSALRADGTEFPIELNIVSSRLGDDLLITAFISDLTERRLTEQQLQRQRDALHQNEKLTAMGSLLANVAHEINNPLSVVVGRSIMLEEEIGGGENGSSVRRIREAAERCVRIVRSFLAMARHREPVSTAADLNQLARDALDMQNYALRSSGIEVSLELHPHLPQVQVDPDQIHQVFLNLLVNAQQAMAESQEKKRLTIRSGHDADRDLVWMTVCDTGPGVPAEVRSRIFEPYFTTKPMGVGTGIGLPVSLGMLQAQGGDLVLEDGEGGGACFRISLPVRHCTGEGAEEPQDSVETMATHPGARLLVVDDEPEVASMLADILHRAGYRVDSTENGWDALERLDGTDYDAIISDLRMPGLDGCGLYREIGRRHPRMQSRILFVTGDVLSPNIAAFLQEVHCPVIEKPFAPEAVREQVEELLQPTPGPAG